MSVHSCAYNGPLVTSTDSNKGGNTSTWEHGMQTGNKTSSSYGRVLANQEAEVLQRKFVRKQRKRSASEATPTAASSLLLLAWRLKKNGAPLQQGRFNRASASEPCFRPEMENHGRGTKIDARQPETTAGPRKTRRAPGGNRARDHPLQRRTHDH